MEDRHLVNLKPDDGVLVPPVGGGVGVYSAPYGAITDRRFGSEVGDSNQENEKVQKAKAKAEEEERVSAQQHFCAWRIENTLIPDAALRVLPCADEAPHG